MTAVCTLCSPFDTTVYACQPSISLNCNPPQFVLIQAEKSLWTNAMQHWTNPELIHVLPLDEMVLELTFLILGMIFRVLLSLQSQNNCLVIVLTDSLCDLLNDSYL